MASKGTAMPMRLPSGQVVWIRVEDEEEPELPVLPPPAPWNTPPYNAPSPYGAPSAQYGAPSAYGGAPPPGSSATYVDTPLPPPPPPYEPDFPEQWTPPQPGSAGPPPGSAPGSSPDGPPRGPAKGWAGLLRPRKAVAHTTEDARPLQGFTEAVSGIAESVRDGLRHAKPDTVEIEFGLDIDVSAGAAVSLIADARAKAAVRITLGWDNREHAEGSPRVIEGSSIGGSGAEESGGSSGEAEG